MELGIYSFGDSGTVSTRQRLADLVSQARYADEAGLDVIALGEHHRADFTLSAPELVLAAISSVTERIRLSTAVTVLSTADPVRVYQQFATLDQLSGGRAEIVAGRGAFTESFGLFGYDLREYEVLFDEKLRLLLELAREERVTWRGRTRAPLEDALVTPRALQPTLPVWVGVGGTPQSAVRAGRLGAPMFVAIFTDPAPARGLVQIYHRAAAAAGHDPAGLRVASGGHMYVGRTSQGARDEFYPYYAEYLAKLPQFPGGMPREVYDQWIRAGLLVGSPQEVIDKIMNHRELLGISRYVGQFDVGGMPAGMVDKSLELFATEVAPVVRKESA
ncbi:luciferase [Asanoa ishikariensis]|uniref:Flavin-dependent oxidoreductase, luciferase family (Includes alkanesulfonate monooxygenase SsuD and methylene tetrahydromethanopterin reductase) n=1 Tax=Asanoa ishikariensis TaxID=137265 RepID=A0A1H3TT59_9ACTN|nr:LLM class flavin-dependent oxidoreductase [Asanoa ishikariensis]GIF61973.1 luciferase [Asanoa ishikariensis]SDZ52519.1 Flavin-dependent oxidoreductase, luciferase family (includes alkanesulfonate monooxygenase SsuD and methylene tetrahydromethanopterin reductase) [Asanoa ishikariensis]